MWEGVPNIQQGVLDLGQMTAPLLPVGCSPPRLYPPVTRL